MRSIVICILIPVLGAMASPPPAAARAGNKTQAKRYFEKGELHYQQGEFGKALSYYKKAHKTYRHAAFIFNIAQCHRQLKQYIRTMKQQIAALQRRNLQKGRLSIITTPGGAAIYVNRVKGAPNATSPAILGVASGQHLIMIKMAGYKTVTKAVDIKSRKVTLVNITLERVGGGVTPPPERRVTTPPPERRVTTPPPERRVTTPPPERRAVTPDPKTDDPKPTGTRSFVKQWWFWTGVGVAVAAIAVGSYAGSTALAMNSEWDDKQGVVDDPDDFKTRAKTLGAVADVMFGLGAAAAIGVTVGAILVSMKRKKERQSAMRILPGCSAHGCGVLITGRF